MKCAYDLGMAKFNALLVFLLFSLCSPVAAQEDEIAPLSEAETAQLVLALERAERLVRYDQAAWHTTDTLREAVPDLQDSGIRSWVVTEAEGGELVTFWKSAEGGYAGVYSALWTGSEVTQRTLLDRAGAELTPEQSALIAAQQLVAASDLTRCSNAPFNTVVFRDIPSDAILVYYLTPQTTSGTIPLGGHYRFTVRNGETVDQRSFTNSCLELPIEQDGQRSEALTVTHLLDPVPTEIHAFSVFAAGLPIYVLATASERIFVVEISGGQFRVRVVG